MPVNYTILKLNAFQAWLLESGTRVIEFLNFAFLLSFSLVTISGYGRLLNLPSYQSFDIIYLWQWWAMALLGVAQLIAMKCVSNRSNQISGIILVFSGCVWFLISALFSVNRFALVTGVSTYAIFGLVCLFAGHFYFRANSLINASNLNGIGWCVNWGLTRC